MKKWEYSEKYIGTNAALGKVKPLFEALESAGKNGWELVSTYITEAGEIVGIFKRELLIGS